MRIAIFGLAKSGTTALAYRIWNSLEGRESGRFLFEPQALPEDPPPRGPVLAKLLIGPPGYADYEPFLDFSRKIVITRDPRDTLISRLLYNPFEFPPDAPPAGIRAFVERVAAKVRNPAAVSTRELVEAMLRLLFPGRAAGDPDFPSEAFTRNFAGGGYAWQRRLEAQMRASFFPLAYESLIADDLDSLEAYLGFPLGGSGEVGEPHRRVDRSRAAGEWKRWFTPEDVRFFEPAFSDCLRDYGYPSERSEARGGALPGLANATTTVYLERMLKARRERLGLKA